MNRKCVSLFAALCLLTLGAIAQADSARAPKTADAVVAPVEVFTFVERMPEFPGGDQAMMMYLQQNIYYPDSARNQGVQGKVFVRFVVADDGSVRNPEIVRGVHPALDAEALRVVREMPRWSPGMQNGKNVNVFFTLPITFRLE
jgi:TonB family protein